MNNIVTMGVDPGKNGAMVVLLNGSTPLLACRTPVFSGEYLYPSVANRVRAFGNLIQVEKIDALQGLMQSLLEAFSGSGQNQAGIDEIISLTSSSIRGINEGAMWPGSGLAAMEQQFVRPVEGNQRALAIGEGLGMWKALLAINRIPLIMPSTKEWTDALGCTPKKNEDAKEVHIATAKKLLPAVSLDGGTSKEAHDGIADAALLALFAYRNMLLAR